MIYSIQNKFLSSSNSETYTKLVKETLEIYNSWENKIDRDEMRAKEELSKISNEDLGINPEMEIKLSEEKYKICLQMLSREKYDDIWFTLKEIKKSDDDFSLEKIAILYIYFIKLPKIEVYFYQNPENISWRMFYSTIDFTEYFMKSHIK